MTALFRSWLRGAKPAGDRSGRDAHPRLVCPGWRWSPTTPHARPPTSTAPDPRRHHPRGMRPHSRRINITMRMTGIAGRRRPPWSQSLRVFGGADASGVRSVHGEVVVGVRRGPRQARLTVASSVTTARSAMRTTIARRCGVAWPMVDETASRESLSDDVRGEERSARDPVPIDDCLVIQRRTRSGWICSEAAGPGPRLFAMWMPSVGHDTVARDRGVGRLCPPARHAGRPQRPAPVRLSPGPRRGHSHRLLARRGSTLLAV